jgi:hypothetical protein
LSPQKKLLRYRDEHLTKEKLQEFDSRVFLDGKQASECVTMKISIDKENFYWNHSVNLLQQRDVTSY